MLKSLNSHPSNFFKKKAKMRYVINNAPCGMPSNFTYSSFPNQYFTGTATIRSRMYDIPSKKATILKKDLILSKGTFPSYIKSRNK